MPQFSIGERDFLLDGEPFQVISGALHYFRVHPGQWRERLRAARQMGLNTIETYVPWNEHEPRRGEFDASGRLDLAAFLELVHDEGMFAIVRPGPFICAEWDGGGLPAWLFLEPGIGIRSSEPRFVAEITRYLERVLAIVEPLQVQSGGPVILVQIENEYGAYGSDKAYLEELVRVTRAAGIDVPLTTVDQPAGTMLDDGSLPELLKTGSFGSRSAERLATLRAAQPTGPLMCSEFWCGWFDHWGAHHHTTTPAESAAELDTLLAAGASVNIYMVHGGTNFGLTNGANDKGVFQPTITSYDYDSPLDEAGRPTEKFHRFREVIARYAPVPDETPAGVVPAPTPTAPLRTVAALRTLAEGANEWMPAAGLPTLDSIGRYRGFAYYRTLLEGSGVPAVFTVDEVRDRATATLDGAYIGTLARELHENALTLPRTSGEFALLVEDEGRVNYGTRIGEQKGLIGPARLDGSELTGWQTLDVDIDALAAEAGALESSVDSVLAEPSFLVADVELDEASDLFLDTRHFGKGLVWVNGFALGRYWRKGPQGTLYVPRPATRVGSNRIVVLELETLADPTVRFAPDLILGHTDF
ncbi:beta-galactosidase [Agromyces atrinae]|uniref:glycoside hydrolase family 35 protein n=1 Tax=Agromyces atrinae TaxID=592376 RepID=UPI001F59A32B|nr:beta-galactosidase family protein [Agromyces atrinae]MCI2957586.1 beta-galactosidase [Agromyces atrinae]